MANELSEAVEDYLKAIYELTLVGERATTSQVADSIGVSPASVTSMLQKMASLQPALVDYQKHHGVSLTQAGRCAALEVIRHHRLLEVFLNEMLGYSWDEVHSEADRLEHYISEELETRLAKMLGNPLVDPHGAPIPSSDFQIPPQETLLLSELRPSGTAVPTKAQVVQVDDSNADLLIYLGKIGLLPGTRISVLDYSPYDGNLFVQIGAQRETRVLGPGVTSQVLVSLPVPMDAQPQDSS